MTTLSTDLLNVDAVPYFLWDEPMSTGELQRRLNTAQPEERSRLLGKIMREARDTDVWKFTTPEEVSRNWDSLRPHLGRRRGFWEFLLQHWREEAIIIDLVRDRSPQINSEKPSINGIRVDTPHEILANKLCALLARAEIRDLVDVRALEIAGHSVEDAIPAAATKDAGLTPAQLGWVLSQIKLGDDFTTPGSVPVNDLRSYLADLVGRLGKLAFPQIESR